MFFKFLRQISSKFVKPKTYLCRNPYTQKVIYEGKLMYKNELMNIIENSYQTSQKWKKLKVEDRKSILMQFINSIQANNQFLAKLVSESMGKPITQSLNEIKQGIEIAKKHLNIAPPLKTLIESSENNFLQINREPMGVVVQFSPWNLPVLYPLVQLIPALLTGNSMLLKHSYMTPQVGGWFQKQFEILGWKNLVTNLEIDVETSELLFKHPKISYINYIGSYESGMSIYESILKQSLMEVSLRFTGKDAAYIREDADLEKAADIIVNSSFENSGQADLSVKRIYVHSKKYEKFQEFIKKRVENLKCGNPLNPDTSIGPLADPLAILELEKQIINAVNLGAKVITGGMQTHDNESPRARFFMPTVVADVYNHMDIVQKAVRGPVVAMSPVDNDFEALRLINDSKYGHAVSIFTKDPDVLRDMASKLEVGQVYGNHCNYYNAVELPHDPRKYSGRGLLLSKYAYFNTILTKSLSFKPKLG